MKIECVGFRPNSDLLKSFFNPHCLSVISYSFNSLTPWLPPSRSDFEEPIPDDRYHGIYFAMLLAGVGFLLPYNSFITDVDYLHHKFEGITVHEHEWTQECTNFTNTAGECTFISNSQKSQLLCVCVFQGRPSCSTWAWRTSWWLCWPSSSTMCWWRGSACTPGSLWVSQAGTRSETEL